MRVNDTVFDNHVRGVVVRSEGMLFWVRFDGSDVDIAYRQGHHDLSRLPAAPRGGSAPITRVRRVQHYGAEK